MLTSTSRLFFRTLEPDDEPLRLELFMTSRERELAALPDGIREMVAMQQYRSYLSGVSMTYPQAQHLAISLADAADPAPIAGMISLTDLGRQLLVIDMAVLPKFRNMGIGTLALEAVMEQCRTTGQIISGSVTAYNPARRLYARLGLRELDSVHGHIRLEWRPDEASRNAAGFPSAGNVQEDGGRGSTDAFQSRLKNS